MGGERAREYMQEKFFVCNQNTANYSHEIHCHEEKTLSTLSSVTPKACRAISASESRHIQKIRQSQYHCIFLFATQTQL